MVYLMDGHYHGIQPPSSLRKYQSYRLAKVKGQTGRRICSSCTIKQMRNNEVAQSSGTFLRTDRRMFPDGRDTLFVTNWHMSRCHESQILFRYISAVPHRLLWADCIENGGASTSHNFTGPPRSVTGITFYRYIYPQYRKDIVDFYDFTKGQHINWNWPEVNCRVQSSGIQRRAVHETEIVVTMVVREP
jgi:hypothetical protein